MSNSDSTSSVSIVFKGSAQSVEDAIKRVSSQLGSLDRTATEASAGLHKTASAEAEVEAEAKGLTRGMEVAADAMALMSKESAEATRRLYEVRSLASDMRGAFSSMGSAIVGGAAAFAGVAAIGFFSGAVKEALAGEQAQAKLNAALKGNKDQIEQVNKSAEDGATTWAKYNVTVGQLKGILATALGKGIDPSMILGNAKGLADLKVALGTDIPGAIDAVTNGPKSAKALSRALNLNKQDAMNLALAMNTAYTANARMAVALQFTEKSRFAGQGDALANTDLGKIATFQTSMKDLQETLGTTIIPLMGSFATAINGMVGSVNSLLGSTHGLSDLLSSKWVPIIALSLVGLKGFLGVVNLIEGLFRTKFVSTLMGTRQEIDQGARATADYAAALDSIPPDVTTTAHFEDTAAKAEKDNVYIPDLNLVDGRVVTTTAAFDDAAALAGVQALGEAKPVVHATGQVDSWAESAAAPVHTSGVVDSWAEPAATAVQTTGTVTGWSEAAAAPVKVTGAVTGWTEANAAVPAPVIGKISGWTEAAATAPAPVVGKITSWTEAGAHAPAPVIGKINGWTETAATAPAPVIGKISGWTEAAATPPAGVRGKITSWTEAAATPPAGVRGKITSWTETTPPPVNVQGNVSGVHVGGTTANVTPNLVNNARSTLQTELNAGGPIPVNVKPQWISNAAEGLKAGIAGGVAMGIADAIFNGAVTIKHATIPTVTMPATHGGTAAPVTQTAIFQGPRVPQPVYLVDPGAIGSARGTATVPTGTMTVQVTGHPYVGLVPNQSLKVSNFPASISATTPTGSTVTMPNTIKAKQDGPWTVSLSPDAFVRFGQMVGEIAIGSALGNVLGNLGIGPIRKFIDTFKGRGGKGGGVGGGDGLDTAVSDAEALVRSLPTTGASVPVITGLQGIANSIAGKIAGAIAVSVAGAAFVTRVGGALATGFVGVMGVIGKLLSGEGVGGATITNPIRGNMAKMVAKISIDFAEMVMKGLEGAKATLTTTITNFFKGIQLGTGQNTDPNKPDARGLYSGDQNHPPHGDRNDFTYVSGRGYSGWRLKPGHHLPPGMGSITGGGAGRGGLTSVSPSLAAQLAAMTGLHVPTSTAAARAGGHTVNVHAGAIVVNGGAAPAHDIAVEVNKQLALFVNAL